MGAYHAPGTVLSALQVSAWEPLPKRVCPVSLGHGGGSREAGGCARVSSLDAVGCQRQQASSPPRNPRPGVPSPANQLF